MNSKKILVILAMTLLFVSLGYAAFEVVQTTINLNVASVLAFTVTLPDSSSGTSGAAASPGSTSTIEFNSSTGGESDVEPCVVGAACQVITSEMPIFSYDNTGTVNLANITVQLNSALPACVTLAGNQTNAASLSVASTCAGQSVNNSAVAIVTASSFTPSATALKYYMCADFSGCSSGTNSVTLNHTGTQ